MTPNIPPHGRFNHIAALLFVVVLGLVSMLPVYLWGIPKGADLQNHFRFAMPFFDELSSGNFMPGWLAESNMGFGDARFRFYPPLIYYILAAARYITGEWYTATSAVFSLFSIVGTIGAYAWARQLLTPGKAVTAAAIFAILPYHFAEYYQASLLAEYAALSLLTFAFLFATRIARASKFPVADILGLGFVFGLIILTHLPSVIAGGLALGFYTLISIDWRRGKRSVLYAAIGMTVALLISSFFWIKMMSELSWIQAGHKVTSEYYDYHNNFLFSPFSLVNRNNLIGSLVAALTVGVLLPVIPAIVSIFRREEPAIGNRPFEAAATPSPRVLGPAVVISIFALFMTTDLSRPIWWAVPKMSDIQFPFRWLSIASVALCAPAAHGLHVCIDRIRLKKHKVWEPIAIGFFALAAGYSIYELAIESEFMDRESFTSYIEDSRGGLSFPDWIPYGAAPLTDVEKMPGEIDARGRAIVASQIGTHRRRFSIAAGDQVDARIRSYYYPLWHATATTVAGTLPAESKPGPDGTLLVAIPAEACEVEVVFGTR